MKLKPSSTPPHDPIRLGAHSMPNRNPNRIEDSRKGEGRVGDPLAPLAVTLPRLLQESQELTIGSQDKERRRIHRYLVGLQ